MGKVSLICILVIVAIGIFAWIWRIAMQRMEERVMERLADAQKPAQPQPTATTTAVIAPANGTNRAVLAEMEGVAPEEFEKHCADVMSQLAARRKQFRRPTTRRRYSKID